MATWGTLQQQLNALPNDQKPAWLLTNLQASLAGVSARRDGRHVLFYASAFLQKPDAPASSLTIQLEDINGLMSVLNGMTWDRGLTLLLHTPGGATNATESIVAYLRSKFDDLEVIVPTYAMSAGTMISLASDRVWLGRHSQLGPIDPQMNFQGRIISARAVVDQFDRASKEVLQNPVIAHAWAPVLQSLGPSLLQEAQNAIDYSEEIVARWLTTWMFKGTADPAEDGTRVAKFFNDAAIHKSHGRRIGRTEAANEGVIVSDLEADQDLQEAVLTAYHVITLMFEQTIMTKVIIADTGQSWMKNYQPPGSGPVPPSAPPAPPRPTTVPSGNRSQPQRQSRADRKGK